MYESDKKVVPTPKPTAVSADPQAAPAPVKPVKYVTDITGNEDSAIEEHQAFVLGKDPQAYPTTEDPKVAPGPVEDLEIPPPPDPGAPIDAFMDAQNRAAKAVKTRK